MYKYEQTTYLSIAMNNYLLFLGGIGAKRFCSSLDLGNYCNYVQQPGDILTYRTCVYTCRGDGCNPGHQHKPYSATALLLGWVFVNIIHQLL